MAIRSKATPAAGVLALLGVDELQEAVYSWLIDHPAMPATGIATEVGASRKVVERALANLEDKGLVTRSASTPHRFMPTPPDAAVNVLVLRRQEQLESARLQGVALAERFRAALDRSGTSVELVEVVGGTPAIGERGAQIRAAAGRELLFFVKPPLLPGIPEQTESTEDEARRGVAIRAIYDPAVLSLPGLTDHVRTAVGAGEHSRTLGVPIKLLIADREVALLPMTNTGDVVDRAMVVRAAPVIEALVALFELHWEKATPLLLTGATVTQGLPAKAALAPLDRAILSFLAAGQKDEAMAAALGVTQRTIGRRIQRLMSISGAATRFQLGDQARTRGWLEPDPSAAHL